MKHKLVDFIIQFMEDVDKEISEMKLFVCSIDLRSESPMRLTTFIAERKSEIRRRVFLDTCRSPPSPPFRSYD